MIAISSSWPYLVTPGELDEVCGSSNDCAPSASCQSPTSYATETVSQWKSDSIGRSDGSCDKDPADSRRRPRPSHAARCVARHDAELPRLPRATRSRGSDHLSHVDVLGLQLEELR